MESCKKWCVCLSGALAYLHAHDIVHGAVRTCNVAICNGQPYLVNFAASGQFARDPALVQAFREKYRRYTPFERLMPPDWENDIYALGILFLDIFCLSSGLSEQFVERFAKDASQSESKPKPPKIREMRRRYQDMSKKPVEGDFDLLETCITPMIAAGAATRPTASAIRKLLAANFWPQGRHRCSCMTESSETMQDALGLVHRKLLAAMRKPKGPFLW